MEIFLMMNDLEENGWLPLAGDGCGDYYVLASKSTVPSTPPTLLFIDQSDYHLAAYAVASGLWHFLWFLLEDELLTQEEPEAIGR